MKDDNRHKAAFLVSTFLMSKRSRKNMYNLNPTAIAILRYIADSIDLSRSNSTKLCQNQIALQNGTSPTTVKRTIKFLVKKRLIKYVSRRNRFWLGIVFDRWVNLTYRQEVGQFDLSTRSRSNRPTSYSSNFTNTDGYARKGQKPKAQPESGYASVESQSTSYRGRSDTKSTRMPVELRRLFTKGDIQ